MRVPLPDISATEKSGFRIVIQTSSPSTRSTSSAASPSISYSPSATRYAFPCACQSDDVIGGLDDNEPGDAPHPFSLVCGVPACAHDDRIDRVFARQVGHLVEAQRLARCLRDRGAEC